MLYLKGRTCLGAASVADLPRHVGPRLSSGKRVAQLLHMWNDACSPEKAEDTAGRSACDFI